MGIEIARHAGFCMGVRRAVDRTLEAAESGGEIVTFGEVVHNPQVIEKLEAMGVYAIHSCEQAAGKTVIRPAVRTYSHFFVNPSSGISTQAHSASTARHRMPL